MGSNPAAPTTNRLENKQDFRTGDQSRSTKNGTSGIQSAEVGTKSPEKLPNSVPLSFPIVIAEWDRNAREVVRVALDYYSGRHTVNARVWYHDDDGLKPGKTGITLAVKHLPALADALVKAEHRARELGLIEGGAQ